MYNILWYENSNATLLLVPTLQGPWIPLRIVFLEMYMYIYMYISALVKTFVWFKPKTKPTQKEVNLFSNLYNWLILYDSIALARQNKRSGLLYLLIHVVAMHLTDSFVFIWHGVVFIWIP